MSEETIFNIFEGVCDCGAEVRVADVGGTPDFIEEVGLGFIFGGDQPTFHTWSRRLPGDCTDGEIEFKCAHGHVTTVAHNTFGDWNL